MGSAVGDHPCSWNPTIRDLRVASPPYGRVTEALWARLDHADIEEMKRRLSPEDSSFYTRIPTEHRKSVDLAFCVHYGVPGVLEKTGLSGAMPPPDVHAMSHVSTDAGGAYYYGDLVDECLTNVNFELSRGMRGLDFGCSSGRVVRMLKVAYPDIEWYGCDPNEGAIEWARQQLPGIDFRVSPQVPPLDYAADHFDLVVAISIWSHFSEPATLDWFMDMGRVVKPGGVIIFTAEGWQSLQVFAEGNLWRWQDIKRTAMNLYAHGFSFMDVFGEEGDCGVKSPDWGVAHLTPDWLATKLLPSWTLLDFQPGRNADHQDVYVMQLRPDP